jgi:hypothetical protein
MSDEFDFNAATFTLSYVLPVPEDRFLVGVGLRAGQLGLLPTVGIQWVPFGPLFYGRAVQGKAGFDFV